MSKIAILKSLPTPADLRQNVQELGQMLAETSERLEQTAKQVQSLEQLPGLVSQQVTEAFQMLEPVLQLRQDVQTALEAFDRLNSVQRQTLEALGQELASRAAQSMERKASGLDTTLQDLAIQVQGLKSTVASMEASSKGMQALPKKLASAAQSAAEQMQGSSQELARQAERVRPSMWLTFGQILGSALLVALLVVGGQAVLNKPAPPSAEIQQRADQLSQLVRKSTLKERELLNQIVSRPDK